MLAIISARRRFAQPEFCLRLDGGRFSFANGSTEAPEDSAGVFRPAANRRQAVMPHHHRRLLASSFPTRHIPQRRVFTLHNGLAGGFHDR
jgi:hypothetical protein